MHVTSPEDVLEDLPRSEDIVREVREKLSRLERKTVDVITLSGSGEPTLNPNIGTITSGIRDIIEDKPLILLTNASLLPRKDVRERLYGFDIVTAKYDAGDEETFKRINHPAKGSFGFHEIQSSIKKLHSEWRGILALEVMLLHGPQGLTNTKGQARKSLVEGIVELNPDLVQIYTPWRPAAMQSVKPVSNSVLQDMGRDLEQHLDPEKLWIYGVHDARGKDVTWRAPEILEQEIVELLKRRPCRISDITSSTGCNQAIVTLLLGMLQKRGIVQTELVDEEIFFQIL
jgi:wyosine [tRNA(Phe)-imidazoG37] synthetase (radical SAM superfamily)